MRRLISILIAVLCSAAAIAQVPLIMPIPEQQFFNGSAPCAGCFVFTYTSGTNNPLATFTDYTRLTQNTNPIVLNAAGYPTTSAGAQVGIWLQATQTYRIVLQNAAHVQIYQIDGITGQVPGSLANPLSILTGTCNQLTIGIENFQTGLCFPAPSANITLTFPNVVSDTMVARTSTDTLTNKTLTSPTITTPTVNGCGPMTGGPGTYICLTNQSPTGTSTNTLTKLVNSPSQAQITAITDTGGIVGICVSACGTTGTATIQQSGIASCVFDGGTVADDYVQNSSTNPGNCHDAGISLPVGSVQSLGRVVSTNAGSGTYQVMLFPPEIRSASTMVCANAATVTVNPPGVAGVPIESCAFPSGALNAVNKTFRFTVTMQVTTAGSYTSNGYFGSGSTSALLTTTSLFNVSTATGTWFSYLQMTCTVITPGSSGSMACTPIYVDVPGASQTFTPILSTYIISGQNFTGVFYVGTGCVFGTGNASNACTNYQFTVEQLN